MGGAVKLTATHGDCGKGSEAFDTNCRKCLQSMNGGDSPAPAPGTGPASNSSTPTPSSNDSNGDHGNGIPSACTKHGFSRALNDGGCGGGASGSDKECRDCKQAIKDGAEYDACADDKILDAAKQGTCPQGTAPSDGSGDSKSDDSSAAATTQVMSFGIAGVALFM